MTITQPTDSLTFGAYAPSSLVRALIGVTRRMPENWAGKRVALAIGRIVTTTLRGRPLDVETLGARMRLFPYVNICEKRVLFTPQLFDPEERAILANAIERAKADPSRAGQGFVFLDVGSNIGAYSLFVAGTAGSSARVLAVEPQADIFERLVANIRFNTFGMIKAVSCAVADKDGELTLFVDAKNRGESSVKIVGTNANTHVRVAAKTLHSLITEEGYGHVDAVKLDVEGAEDIILEPFFRHAPKELWPCLLIIEDGAQRWQIDLPKLVKETGYRLVAKTRLNFVFERTI